MKLLLAGVFSVICAFSANAALISVNHGAATAQTLNLNGQVSSFLEFYNFDNGVPVSSNTGLEIAGQLTVFITELETQPGISELGIFAVTRGLGGEAGLNIDLFSTSGMLSFVEEAYEQRSANNLAFKFYNNRGDGFIFSGISAAESFNLTFTFSNLLNISQYSVLDFTTPGSPTVIVQGDLSDGLSLSIESLASSINAPSAFSLTMIAGLLLIRRKAK